MYPQGVYILYEADCDHIAVCIPHHFQFQFLPAQDGLLHQNLAYQGSLQAPGTDSAQFVPVVHQSAPGAAHGVGRAQHHRISQPVRNPQGILHCVGHFTPGHLYS